MKGLYRGLLPTLVGMIPYAGLAFFCFDLFKATCITRLPHLTCYPASEGHAHLSAVRDSGDGQKYVLTVPAKLVCGGMSGAVAQTVAYPLDVARRRMQLAMMLPETVKFA